MPPMPGDRHPRTNSVEMIMIDALTEHRFALGERGLNLTPGIDKAAMAKGLTTAGVSPTLIGGENVTLGFDRPGAQQNFPVRRSGDRREGRRHNDQVGTSAPQLNVKLGKAQIVTDAQPHPSDRRIDAHHTVAKIVIA